MAPTLYDRMGGDNAVILAIIHFFEQIGSDPDLQPFFENISISALQAHQLKLFKVIFGPEEEKPDPDDFLNFMLATHTRLFRELGLNETHFDKVAACFVRALQELQADQDVIDESVAILVPLRDVFELGAKVAAQEKTYTGEELKLLPTTTAKNMSCAEPTTLPDPCHIDIPSWLPEILAEHSANGVVRAWTKDMIDRYGAGDNGDKVVADTFLDMPYMNHHVYCAAILQLAFLPDGFDNDMAVDLLQVVKYPRGPNRARLCEGLWDRMIQGFQATCDTMQLDAATKAHAVENLKFHSFAFPAKKHKLCGGATAPHVLKRVPQATFDISAVEKENSANKQRASNKSTGSKGFMSSSHTTSSYTSGGYTDAYSHSSCATSKDHQSCGSTASLSPSQSPDNSDHLDVSESNHEHLLDVSHSSTHNEHKLIAERSKQRRKLKRQLSSKPRRKRTRSVWSKLLGWTKVQ